MKPVAATVFIHILGGAFCSVGMLSATPGSAVADSSLGRIVHLQGNVMLQRGKASPRPLRPGDQFRLGDRLTAPPQTEASILFYASGKRFLLKSGSSVRVGAQGLMPVSGTPPEQLTALPAALGLPLATAAPPTIPHFGATIQRGAHPKPTADSPIGGLREPAPITLRWSLPNDNDATVQFRVRVIDSSTQTVVFEKADLPAGTTLLTLPAGIVKPGQLMQWMVAVRVPDDEGYPASGHGEPHCFVVLTEAARATAARLDAAAARLAATDKKENRDAYLLLGAGYESVCLWKEAADAYRSALRAGPDAGATLALRRLESYLTAQKPD